MDDRVVARLKSVSRTLTAAETLALNTTAIELVPAPGAGYVLVPHRMVTSKAAGTAGGAGGDLQLRVGTNVVAAETRARVFPAAASVRHVLADENALAPNAAMDLHMASDDMTGNNRDLHVTVFYSTVRI